MKKILLHSFLICVVSVSLFAQSDADAPLPEPLGNNLYAGIELTTTNMRPVVFQIDTLASGKVCFKRVSMALSPDGSIKFDKIRTPQQMIFYAKRIASYVEIFQSPMYQIKPERIYVLMSSTFFTPFNNDSHAIEELKEIIRQYNPDINISQFKSEEEADDCILGMTSDGVLSKVLEQVGKRPVINIIDVNNSNFKGGYLGKAGSPVNFNLEGGVFKITKLAEKEITDNNWNLNNTSHRREIAKFAASQFREKYLPNIKMNSSDDNVVVLAGGIVFTYSVWLKAQEIPSKSYHRLYAKENDSDEFLEAVIDNPDNQALFEQGPGGATVNNFYGERIFASGKRALTNVQILTGAAILNELVHELRNKRGTKTFIFNTDLWFSALYYHISEAARERPRP